MDIAAHGLTTPDQIFTRLGLRVLSDIIGKQGAAHALKFGRGVKPCLKDGQDSQIRKGRLLFEKTSW
ncbi:hypothetical protein COW36_02675 [bacterium (Candidatus Blackallbacteria) CG17_big_fil_post_rev_8_21_14_2_50_48_46]|uniref:Uncharacterized protein n=1 Tax=bacterium (Candidatus Blackallbacteria) CG17_big_fil_post_rev_8_21_14_2_50_48_46 TaxID=2014261 RepID=A0A2M7GA55_9BACT|nr:MAG: hypothetical protein COW36_02675 [bacterium (Candidatus Blackallbacteria) CG17_big_fil_post_rev_8_21_14_2_50_48_46]